MKFPTHLKHQTHSSTRFKLTSNHSLIRLSDDENSCLSTGKGLKSGESSVSQITLPNSDSNYSSHRLINDPLFTEKDYFLEEAEDYNRKLLHTRQSWSFDKLMGADQLYSLSKIKAEEDGSLIPVILKLETGEVFRYSRDPTPFQQVSLNRFIHLNDEMEKKNQEMAKKSIIPKRRRRRKIIKKKKGK